MSNTDAKNRTTKIKQGSKGCQSEGQSGGVGTVRSTSKRIGTYKIGTGGGDSDRQDSSQSKLSAYGVPGKILSQLIEENQKQLAYHEQQVETLRKQAEELMSLSKSLTEE